jgi:hypothetical protein
MINKVFMCVFLFCAACSHADECTPIVDSLVNGFIQGKADYERDTGKQSNLAPVLAEINRLRQRYQDCVVLAKSEPLKSTFLGMLKMNEMVE